MKPTTQSYNNGNVSIYKVTNTANSGDRAKKELILQQALRFEERTVGYNRFYAALKENIKVAFVIRCPEIRGLSEKKTDILVAILNETDQYEVKQIQFPKDVEPPSMDLTLEMVGTPYEIYVEPEVVPEEGDPI